MSSGRSGEVGGEIYTVGSRLVVPGALTDAPETLGALAGMVGDI